MADCSAVGTTIDRAARAVLGGGRAAASMGPSAGVAAAASKHVGALLGHASMMGPSTSASGQAGVNFAPPALPMTAPDHLIMPVTTSATTYAVEGRSTIANHPNPMMMPMMQQRSRPPHRHHQPQQQHHHHQFQPFNPSLMTNFQDHHHEQLIRQHQQQAFQMQQHLHYQQQQQQQQQAMTMMIQEQQRMMQQMHHQHQRPRQPQQQEQYQNQSTNTKAASAAASVARTTVVSTQKAEQPVQDNGTVATTTTESTTGTTSLEDWHQGLEDDLAAELAGGNGHEGIVHGASLEQLAAAWAEAEWNYDDDGATVASTTLGGPGEHGAVRGAGMEELAAAWARAEAELDDAHHLDGGTGHGTAADGYHDEEDFANLWQGDMPSDGSAATTRPYEFVNAAAAAATTTGDVTAAPDNASAQSSHHPINFMEEGMEHFREGNMREAIRSFEMELQLGNADNATAWRMLGRCHAENDQDRQAIQCLEAAVDRDPFSPEALLALGVSYVNELDHDRALESMKAWFTHNPKYAGMELPTAINIKDGRDDIYGASSNGINSSAFDEVRSMLQLALEHDPTDAGDVHEALGVIYNVSKDYDAAAESFRRALQSRPDDYQLWNKLGATLANDGQSDRALPAYHSALQRKPKYTRAWLNMAISHSNLQDHQEAARCYLQTLSLNPAANHCWTYLRMALSSMERWDLLPLVFSQDLSAFQEHFDFVLY
jgi:peroxin-5